MRTRAAVLRRMSLPGPYAESRPLSVETVELAPPGAGEVLVRVRAAGLCHSDLSTINGDRPRPMPMVLGHEAAGVVEALGEGVDDLEVGDHVVMVFIPSCGQCPSCSGGRPALCEPAAAANIAGVLDTGGVRLSNAEGPILHHLGVSAFAEHAVVSRHSLVRFDRDLPFVEAALFGCAVLTGVGAVMNTAGVRPGSSVAVVGLGGVGLAALLGARAAGAEEVVAVDVSPDKLALAEALGATAVVRGGTPEAVEAARAATSGGADYVFEMAGSARALDDAFRMTRRGGMTVTAGLPPPTAELPVNIVKLVVEERTLKGSYMGSCIPQRDIPRFIEMYRSGRLPVDRLLSGTIRLDDINEGFDRLSDGSAVRQVIEL